MCVTDKLCLSQAVCVCHRQSVSVTDSLFLSQTVHVCHGQFFSVTENICLSEKVCVCHRICDTDSMCLSQKVCVFPRPFFLIASHRSLCLSQIICACHRTFLSLSLCLYQTLFLIILGWLLLILIHQHFSLRFQFFRDFNPNNPNFVDPWGEGGVKVEVFLFSTTTTKYHRCVNGLWFPICT